MVDEAVTVAALPPFALVTPGTMVATVKTIPFAVPAPVMRRAAETAAGLRLDVAVPMIRRAVLIQTVLTGTQAKVLNKTQEGLDRRLAVFGLGLSGERRCPHDSPSLRDEISGAIAAGADMVLVMGASAVTDRRDVVPAAIEAAGGVVEHFGMPVDPGNLLLTGRVGTIPVLSVPGCARTPKPNGFDWVLGRLVCGIVTSGRDIQRMGAGGLIIDSAATGQRTADGPMLVAQG